MGCSITLVLKLIVCTVCSFLQTINLLAFIFIAEKRDKVGERERVREGLFGKIERDGEGGGSLAHWPD